MSAKLRFWGWISMPKRLSWRLRSQMVRYGAWERFRIAISRSAG